MRQVPINVHVITPIISTGFRNDGPLRAACPQGCTLVTRYLQHGPASVESAVDEVLAAPGVVDAALMAETEGADALVIDCMLDPGLDAAREATAVPVIGCGEAALRAAADIGPFAIVTVLARQARAFGELARRHDLGEALRSVRGIGVPVLELDRNPEAAIAATIREARSAVAEDGARAIVFGCTGMLGFGGPVEAALEGAARVIDPLPLAVERACEAARAGQTTDKAAYPAPERKRIAGFDVWPALDRAINAEARS